MDYISKIEGHPIKAECLKESARLLDKEPYLFRKSFSNGYANDKLVGGTVAFNQLNQQDFTQTSNSSVTESGGVYTITSTGNGTFGADNAITLPENHKFLFLLNADDSHVANMDNYSAILSTTGHVNYETKNFTGNGTILNGTYGAIIFRLRCNGSSITAGSYLLVNNIMIIDLTAFFGSSAIADYVYNLEQSTAGAGVAWLKANGFFTKDYYAYDSGSLLSVKTSAHKTTGANLYSGVSKNSQCSSTGAISLTSSSNYLGVDSIIRVLPNTQYSFALFGFTVGSFNIGSYDKNGNFIVRTGFTTNVDSANNAIYGSFTTDANTYGVFIYAYDPNGPYSNISNAKLMLAFGSHFPNAYEPYIEHNYALDDVELRGLFKLDSNNKLYADGDTYESSGDVTRKYGIVDLGTLNWVYNANYGFLSATLSGTIKGEPTYAGKANVISDKYLTDSYNNVTGGTTNKCIGVSPASYGYIVISDSDYSDAATFKAALSGKYLVYEKVDTTTETADPFTNPQLVDKNGTEEYVDNRTVPMPVGHNTIYVDNSDKTKLDNLPDISDNGNGTYVIKQEDGKQSLVTPNAADISYSNTSSGLASTKVQGAIDEINEKLNLYESATSGNPCSFTTKAAYPLVSLSAEITASGGGGTPSTPIPIVGISSLDIVRCGVNQWNEEWKLKTIGGLEYLANKYPIPVQPNTTYYIVTPYSTSIDNVDENDTYKSFIGNRTNATFTTPADCHYIRFAIATSSYGNVYNNDISINYPSTDTAYHEYNGQTFTIDLGGTRYGGYIDAIRGKLRLTWGCIDLEDESLVWVWNNIWFQTESIPNIKYVSVNTQVGNALAEEFTIRMASGMSYAQVGECAIDVSNVKFVTANSSTKPHGLFAYELATPIEIDVSAILVNAISGVNNISSNGGGDVEVKFTNSDLARQIMELIKMQ